VGRRRPMKAMTPWKQVIRAATRVANNIPQMRILSTLHSQTFGHIFSAVRAFRSHCFRTKRSVQAGRQPHHPDLPPGGSSHVAEGPEDHGRNLYVRGKILDQDRSGGK